MGKVVKRLTSFTDGDFKKPMTDPKVWEQDIRKLLDAKKGMQPPYLNPDGSPRRSEDN